MPSRLSRIGLSTLILRLLEHLHGHLGWLTAAALVHPAIVLRRTRRRAHLAVGLSAGMIAAVFALGCYIYPAYREQLRQRMFIEAPRYGFFFERKEHLAVGALGLALAGALAYAVAQRTRDDATTLALRKAAHYAFVGAASLAIVAAALGTVVASFKSF